MPDLPRRLETTSKYDQSFASKSVIDPAARQRREDQLMPVASAIRSLVVATRRNGSPDQINRTATCTIATLRHWAVIGALTEMATSDANLSRDRFTSDIAGVVMMLQARGQDLRGEVEVRTWLETLARQTMAYYDGKAGATARRNNHRYWAGIAVAEIAEILGDKDMQAWSREAFTIGACQIDEQGYLPLELARAERAYEYHLYAYSALAGLAIRLSAAGAIALPCEDRLDRLYRLVSRGEDSARDFATRTGLRQRPPSRRHLEAVAVAPPHFNDMRTTGDVKYP
ncbi:alginate lyase family protein [Rhizobium glycinendophyticum]|nr:alginate lyase family protein [Rhizobium glycinendophyticum]